MHRLVLATIHLRTKIEVPSIIHYKDRTGPQSLKMSHVMQTVPFLVFVVCRLVFAVINLCTKFKD